MDNRNNTLNCWTISTGMVSYTKVAISMTGTQLLSKRMQNRERVTIKILDDYWDSSEPVDYEKEYFKDRANDEEAQRLHTISGNSVIDKECKHENGMNGVLCADCGKEL